VDGITAAAVGAITGSVLVIARRLIVDWPTLLMAVVTIALLWRFKRLPEPVVVLAAAIIGVLIYPLIRSHGV
ncbi:MAG: chromate transporter, partial [Pandoraea sp.]|nr:chromate transporter [Pandoraea sp.]